MTTNGAERRDPTRAGRVFIAGAAVFAVLVVSGQGWRAAPAGPPATHGSASGVVLNPREHLAHLELVRMREERAREWVNPREHLGHRDVRPSVLPRSTSRR